MPAPSVPGTIGNFALGPHGRQDPSRTSPSQEPTPAAWRAMRTSRGPGFGTGRRWSVSTEGGPNSSIAAAFIVCGIVDCRKPAATRFVMASPSRLGPVLRSEKETSDFSFSNRSLEASGWGGTVFPREVAEVPASARSSSRSSHRRWGPLRVFGLSAPSLSSGGKHRGRGDQDSDARQDAAGQNRIPEKPRGKRRGRVGEGEQESGE